MLPQERLYYTHLQDHVSREEKRMKWTTKFIHPSQPGYYLTVYVDRRTKTRLYKAFWWDGSNWTFWYGNPPDVICWYDVRHEFYVPCQTQENVEDVPAKILNTK
jgi:hypothetical protein